jgi:hypothetical protein
MPRRAEAVPVFALVVGQGFQDRCSAVIHIGHIG